MTLISTGWPWYEISMSVIASPNRETTSTSKWVGEPGLSEALLISFAAAAIFVGTIVAVTPYFAAVDRFADNSAYISIAVAIRKWNFHGVFVKQFWGLPYCMAAVSKLTGFSDRTSLLLISWISAVIVVILAYRLWGGWVATAFSIVNFDWYQRAYLGGSEPLFVALLFGSFIAIRRDRWILATLLAALATTTRPLGVFLLVGIGLTLLWRREWRRFAFATTIGLIIGVLYMLPLAYYFHDPLATVHSYKSTDTVAQIPLFGIPFYAIIKGTLLYPSPITNLLLSFGWVFLVLIAIVAMIGTENFRQYARRHPAEIIFAVPYLLSLYCYNYPYWARGNFARFAIPIVPFVFLALWRWIPKDRRLLWLLAPVTAVMAASSAIGVRNILHVYSSK
jgi:hypothetical protein